MKKRFLSVLLSLALLLSLTPYLPAKAAGAPMVYAGGKHTLVLTSDGSLWAAGSNTKGQLGLGHKDSTEQPQKINLANVVSAAAGDLHSLAITADGSLYAWGSNKNGQLGLNSWIEIFAAPQLVMTGVSAVSAGTGFTVILKLDGSVWAAGKSDSGSWQLGTGISYQLDSHEFVPVKLPSDKRFSKVSAGTSYAFALSTYGEVYAWGNNAKGTLGVEKWDSESRYTPVLVATDIVDIAAGESFSFFIDSKGQLFGNGSSYLGNGLAADRLAGELIEGMDNCLSATAGPNHAAVLKKDGSLWVWGDNSDGQLGLGNTDLQRTPVKVASLSNVKGVSTSDRHTMMITADGKFWATGYNGLGRLCNASTESVNAPTEVMRQEDQTPKPTPPLVTIVPGDDITDALRANIAAFKAMNIAPDELFSNYKQNISRKEMAYLLIALYQKLTSKTLNHADFKIGVQFFEDTLHPREGTADLTILMAFELGLMDQVRWRTFAPEQVITPAEMNGLFVNLCKRTGYSVSNADLPTVPATEYAVREQALYIGHYIATAAINKRSSVNGIGAPVYRWGYAGTNNIWSYEWLYSSPAIDDVDGDGRLEIISSGYNTICADAQTGQIKWRILNGEDITNPVSPVSVNFETNLATWDDVVIADIDGDGKKEIVIAHQRGRISVLDGNGKFKPGWEHKTLVGMDGITANDAPRFMSMCVGDLDGDGKMEIVLGRDGDGKSKNVYVLNHDGSLRPGWPQKNPVTPGNLQFVTGMFGDTISIGDVDGDGTLEIIVPCDTRSAALYRHDGTEVRASDIYDNRVWSEIPFWYDYEYEKNTPAKIALDMNNRPTSDDPLHMRYAISNAYTGTAITDVDGDGKNEIVMTATVFDYALGIPPSVFVSPLILNADHTRYNKDGYNWEVLPKTGGPLSTAVEQGTLMLRPNSVPTVEDIDGDGKKEILFPAYDGKLHVYWLDGTEHQNWPVSVYDKEMKTLAFPGFPAVYDFNGDGKKEVVFTSYVEREASSVGYLYIADYNGNVLHKTELPISLSTESNGAVAAPIIRDVDGDGAAEIILNTIHSGLVVYDVPLVSSTQTTPQTTPQAAAGYSNFKAEKTYAEGSLSDIGGKWYTQFIKSAYEYGFVSGIGDNKFGPDNNFTYAEAIQVAAGMHSIYKYGSKEMLNSYAKPDGAWWSAALGYAKAEGLVDSRFDGKITSPITRAETIYVFYKLGEAITITNSAATIPDMRPGDPYYNMVLGFYQRGIVQGSSVNGVENCFSPNNLLTRAEAATIFMNIVSKGASN